MSFDAHEEKIRKIFAGDTRFEIPRNQRRYIWEEKQWKELFSDILYIRSRRMDSNKEINHFLGSFVLQENDTCFEIIDGQQRITTLFLILSAICRCFNCYNSKEEHGITRQYLSGNINLKSQYMRLDNNNLKNISFIMAESCKYDDDFDRSKPLDLSILDRINEGNQRIIKCFQFFYQNLLKETKTIEDLILIREIVLDMKVIHIASEDELDCYDIFEILNARGVDLEESELLKNYIFKYAQPEYTVDKAKEIWSLIENNMDACSGNMEQFLAHFVTYRYYKPKKDEGVFRIIKTNTDKSTVKNLLDDLLKASKYYISFYDPNKAVNKQIEKCLAFYKLVNHRQFRPLFMVLFEKYDEGHYSEKELTETCKYLKDFSFAYTLVMGNASNTIDTKIHEMAKKIYNTPTHESLSNLKDILFKFYPSEDEFLNAFMNLGFSNKNPKFKNSNNKKRMFYIHKEIEEFRQETKELSCNVDTCNLEHIMNDSESDAITSKAGNILLLSDRINENMGSDNFEIKKEKMKRSRLITVQNFLKYYGKNTDWTMDMIKDRTRKLGIIAYREVWQLNK